MRILLIAPTCDGDDVGESWVTWQWVSRLASAHEVTVLSYYKRDRTPLTSRLQGARVVEWREPPLLGRFERLNSLLKPGYLWFYIRAWRWIRQSARRGEAFDVCHQLAPVSLRFPSPAVAGSAPYIVGPVGGSIAAPAAFEAEDRAPWYVGLRRLDHVRLRRDPLLRHSFRKAACVLVIADYVIASLATVGCRRVQVEPDVGVESLPAVVDRSRRPDPVRLLFVGRFIRTKGVRDAIRALALCGADRLTFDVVGDGFDRAACESLAHELGVAHMVSFHGRVPADEVGAFYRAADVFLFPSYREAGGIVVAEAMSHGLPIICCAVGGPASTTDDSCAIRVEAIEPRQYAEGLAEAITTLVSSPERRQAMGAAARVRIGEVGLWDTKVRRLSELYEQIATKGVR